MTWNKLKNFLIGLFVCINIFLIINTITIYNSYKLSDDVIKSTCALLKNNDITINPDIIPKSAPAFENIEFEPATQEDVSIINECTVGDDGAVTFTINRKDFYKKKAENIFKGLGFNKKSIKVVEDYIKDGVRYININQLYNKKTVYSSYIKAKITKNGVAQISFKWYNVTDGYNTEAVKGEPVFASSVLIDFINSDARKNESKNIISVDTGYFIPSIATDGEVRTISAIPVYCIKTDDGKSYCFNAYNGSFAGSFN